MTSRGKLIKVDNDWFVTIIEKKLTNCKLHPKNIEFVEKLISEGKIKEGEDLNFYVGSDCLINCWGLCGDCYGMEMYASISQSDYI
jgi:hypothetical protein